VRLTLALLFVASVTASWRERLEAQDEEDGLESDEDVHSAAGPNGSPVNQGLGRLART
jgi:hypothetical protein